MWAIHAEGGRLAALTDAGISIHASDDGRQLAMWPGVELQGGGISVGHHWRPIRDVAFADHGNALIAYDTRNYNSAETASRLWLWRWKEGPAQLLSEQAPINMIAVNPAGDLIASRRRP